MWGPDKYRVKRIISDDRVVILCPAGYIEFLTLMFEAVFASATDDTHFKIVVFCEIRQMHPADNTACPNNTKFQFFHDLSFFLVPKPVACNNGAGFLLGYFFRFEEDTSILQIHTVSPQGKIKIFRKATGPWSPCNISGPVAASSSIIAPRVQPTTSTSS